ncbi:MAG: hypothetical protein ACRD8Z_26100 [Nitrososphaeraceae archaeon]
MACRESALPRAFNEVAEISNIRRKEMWKAYRAIVTELDLMVPLIDPVRCLVKLANKTDVNEKVKRYGIDYETSNRQQYLCIVKINDYPIFYVAEQKIIQAVMLLFPTSELLR